MTDAAAIIARLVGQKLSRFDGRENDWFLAFEDATLSVGCSWRILRDASVFLTANDHRQQFGFPASVDAEKVALETVGGKVLRQASFRPVSNDLLLDFGDAILELLTDSSGYESWHLSMSGLEIVCMGGGRIAVSEDGKVFR